MDVLLSFLVFVCSYFAMEFVAWFTHKYIMHGFLWILHKDHHTNENKGFIQKNDTFFLIFALPGAFLTIWGALHTFNLLFWAGLGITFYGLTYFLLHEVYIHRRFNYLKNIDHPYFVALRKAHRVHHKYIQKTPGENFGLLLFPLKYYVEAKKTIK
jgi:beta-carotene 3-hydroxylase